VTYTFAALHFSYLYRQFCPRVLLFLLGRHKGSHFLLESVLLFHILSPCFVLFLPSASRVSYHLPPGNVSPGLTLQLSALFLLWSLMCSLSGEGVQGFEAPAQPPSAASILSPPHI
jgi:hypothetical protein